MGEDVRIPIDVLTQILDEQKRQGKEFSGKLNKIDNHLENLNSKVAKNAEWIGRYDIRIAEEIPSIQKKVDSMNIKLAIGTGIIIAAQFFISKFL